MKSVIGIVVTLIILVGMMPFLDAVSKIEWTTYLGIPLVILAGSAGTAFMARRFEIIIGGVILSALWPVIFDMALSCLRILIGG